MSDWTNDPHDLADIVKTYRGHDLRIFTEFGKFQGRFESYPYRVTGSVDGMDIYQSRGGLDDIPSYQRQMLKRLRKHARLLGPAA